MPPKSNNTHDSKSTEERLLFLEKKIKKLQRDAALSGTPNEPPKKKKLTAHNLFMRNALKSIRDQHPNLNHKEVFAYANKLWKQEKEGVPAVPLRPKPTKPKGRKIREPRPDLDEPEDSYFQPDHDLTMRLPPGTRSRRNEMLY